MHRVESYTDFANIYDLLMKDVPYDKWANFIELLFKKQQHKTKLVCELGCGTGSMANVMASRGYSMIAIDKSYDMLSQANKKNKNNNDLLFLCQDMRSFELYGTVDAFICVCDSINYILKLKDVYRVFKLVKNYLNKDGLFIFDVNTEYYFKNILANKTFTSTSKKVSYIWKNFYNKDKRLHEYDIHFFSRTEKNNYKRFNEYHYERAHKLNDLIKLARMSGLTVEGIYDGYSNKKYKNKSTRICIVLKNKGGEQ